MDFVGLGLIRAGVISDNVMAGAHVCLVEKGSVDEAIEERTVEEATEEEEGAVEEGTECFETSREYSVGGESCALLPPDRMGVWDSASSTFGMNVPSRLYSLMSKFLRFRNRDIAEKRLTCYSVQ